MYKKLVLNYRIIFKVIKLLIQKLARKYKKNVKINHGNCVVDFNEVLEFFVESEIKASDKIFIHSSYKGLGKFQQKPNEIISLLKNFFGESGVLMFPAFTMKKSQYDTVKDGFVFDLENLKITTGVLPGLANKDPEFIRSLHPTHSVLAYGCDAFEATKSHGEDGSSTGVLSPFWYLVKENGYVVNIGTDFNTMTLVHTFEEMYQEFFPIKTLSDLKKRVVVKNYGVSKTLLIKLFQPNLHFIRDVNVLKKYLSNDDFRYKKIGSGYVQIIRAKAIFEGIERMAEEGETIYGKY